MDGGGFLQYREYEEAVEPEALAPVLLQFTRADLDTRQALLTAGCMALAIGIARMAEPGLVLSLSLVEDLQFQSGIGVCLFDRSGRVFVQQRAHQTVTAWQLPQGNMHMGEEPLQAAQRLLKAQVGIEELDPLSQAYGWVRWEFPPATAEELWKGRWRGQQQKWFALSYTGRDDKITFGEAKTEWSEWKWASLGELSLLLKPFKRASLHDVAALFSMQVTQAPAPDAPHGP